MHKYFVFISGDKYPNADAGAIRTHSFVLICKELGYIPFVVGMGDYTGRKVKKYDQVDYCSLRLKGSSVFARLFGRILFPIFAIRELKRIGLNNISGIMTTSGSKYLLAFLKKYSQKNNVPVLFDSVEWYSPCELKKGKNSYLYKVNDNLNRNLITMPLKVVAISRYLDNYFSQKGMSTVRIPVILDVYKTPYSIEKENNAIIKIVYAGMPGVKDHLLELIEAANLLPEEQQRRLQIRVIGITEEIFYSEWWNNKKLTKSESVKFEGRQSRDYVIKALCDSDFSFLLRPSEERYAKAGFPTKVAESCSCGTAMLCNYSSDLELYLHDGENSVVIRDCSTEACVDALKRLLLLDNTKITEMKRNARLTAEKYFNWKGNIEVFKKFVSEAEK